MFNFDLSSPEMQAMVGGVIRHLIVLAGGAGVLSQNQLGQLAGALAVIVGIGWSIYQKKSASTAAHVTLTAAVNATDATPASAAAVIDLAKSGKI